MPRFQMNERVRYIGNEGNDNCHNQYATIIYVREYDDFDSGYDYGIKFDNHLQVHNCSGRCDNGYGLWANEDQLEKLNNEEEEKIVFNVGDRVKAVEACDHNREFIGMEGEVLEVKDYETRLPILVRFSNGREWYCEKTSLINLTLQEKEANKKEKKVDISKIKNKVIINFGDEYYSGEYKVVKVSPLDKVVEQNTPRFAEVIADKIVILNKYNLRIYGVLNPHIEDKLIEVNCNNWRLDGGCYEEIKTLPSYMKSMVIDLDTGNYYDYIPEGFVRCKHCGSLVKKALLMGDWCEKCITQSDGLGYRFGYHSFYGEYKLLDTSPVDTSKTLTFGCEIERDYLDDDDDDFSKDLKNALSSAVRELYTPKELLKNHKDIRKATFMCDGSLCRDGIEYITFPATYKWYKRHKKQMQNVLDAMKQFGFGNSSSCGNHIHFNRDYFGDDDKFAGAKMALLLNEYWDEFLDIAKRDCTDYCEKPKQKMSDNIFKIVEKTLNSEHDHTVAINLQHSKTIECRIWGGIDNVDELLLYMDITQSLAKYCKKNGIEKCQKAKFADLFRYMTDKKVHIPMIMDRLSTCKYDDDLRKLIKEVR